MARKISHIAHMASQLLWELCCFIILIFLKKRRPILKVIEFGHLMFIIFYILANMLVRYKTYDLLRGQLELAIFVGLNWDLFQLNQINSNAHNKC